MRKVTWGVIGTAGIAEGQTIPGMQQAENCRLYAIAGRSLEKAQAFQEKFGFEKAYGSYEELLDDPEVEAVYIALPNDLHHKWAFKALWAKKHVLCEKPLAPTLDEAKQLFKVAEINGVQIMEGFAYLHSPAIAAIKQELDSGAIGDLRYMDAAFMTSDYDLSNIRMHKSTFGGATYDLGCYTTSLALWMIGQEPTGVQAVSNFSAQYIDLCTNALLRFPGEIHASLQFGMVLNTEPFERIDRMAFYGTKGSIQAEFAFNQCGDLTYVRTTPEGTERRTVSCRHNYCLEVEQLGRVITDGEDLHVNHEFTLQNLKIMSKILTAIRYNC